MSSNPDFSARPGRIEFDPPQMDVRLFLRSMVLGAAFAVLFIYPTFRIGLSLPLFFGLSWALAPRPRLTTTHVVFAGLALLPVLCHSLWTQFFVVPLVLYFSFHQGCGLQLKSLGTQLVAVPSRIAHGVWSVLTLLRGIMSFTEWTDDRSTARFVSQAGPVLKGLLLSVPLCIVLGALLGGTDVRFENWMKDLFAMDGYQFLRLVVFAACALFIVNYDRVTRKARLDYESIGRFRNQPIEWRSFTAFLVPINVLFTVYLVFQASYLFGSEGVWSMIESGAPQRSYMREGFVQVNIVAMLVALVIWIGKGRTTADSAGNGWLKAVLTILVLQTLVILASSAWRLVDFIGNTGPTLMRYQVAIFMVWMALAMGVALLFIWDVLRIVRAVQVIVVAGFSILSLFAASPYETLLVRHTHAHFVKTGYLFDIDHLLESVRGDGLVDVDGIADNVHGVGTWAHVFGDDEAGLHRREDRVRHWNRFVEAADETLATRRVALRDRGRLSWRSFNLPQYRFLRDTGLRNEKDTGK